MIVNDNRSDAYICTVNMSDIEDMKLVASARKLMREVNTKLREGGKYPMYIKLQGRGHRMGNRRYNQSLPLKYAETADVYMYERR